MLKILLFSILALAAGPALAAVSIQALVEVVVWLIVVGMVFGLLYYLVDHAPFIMEPWRSGIKYLILFVAVIMAINFLLGLVGHPIFSLR